MCKIKYEEIKGMHLEITTKCNAICPMCSRNFKGKVRNHLKVSELCLDDCKKIFDIDFLKQLEFISICGVYGDPINASELIEIIDYLYYCNKNLYINIYTNGSIRDELWWKRLAVAVKNGSVIFGIDGVGDTSAIHRGNTNYDIVIRNAKAYIQAGGVAKWDYIVFKHNEHQVELAEEISKQLGFKSFQIKKTSRFFKNLYEQDSTLDSTFMDYGKHPIFDSEGNIINYIELPTEPKYKNSSEDKLFNLIEKHHSLNKYFDLTNIECQAIKTNGIFVSAMGDVFPCCTVYQQICYFTINGVTDPEELNEYNIWKNHKTSSYNYSIKEIVEGEFFKQLQKSWELNSITNGKPKACCRTCASDLNIHAAQHTNTIKK